jgi:hypothetical protein
VGADPLSEASVDKVRIKKTAEDLDMLLHKYAATDHDVSLLKSALSKLIKEARNESIDAPLEWSAVPGGYFFFETEIAKHGGLENAYAEFKIAITGGETPVLKKLRRTIGR